MGKSPGKWFRSLLPGKKSSKYTSKKSSNEKASFLPTNGPLSSLSVGPPLVSEPVANSAGGIKEDSNFEKVEKEGVAKFPSDEVILSSMKQDGDAQNVTCLTSPEDSEKIKLEQAATKTQAIFRGYLARQEFLRLKGITKLQALVRGRLVRRQAVATLYCIHAIVKLQAHMRGKIVRCSTVDHEVPTKRGLGEQGAKQLDYQRTSASNLALELSRNAFTTRLLASSPTVMTLHLQYAPEEPNCSQEWLLRWTISRIWRPHSKPKTISKTKHKKVEADQAMSKHNGRKIHSKKMQNGTNQTSSGSEKKKSSHLVNSVVLQNSGNEIKKVKHNLKKISSPMLEKSVQTEVDSERKRQINENSSSIVVPEGSMTCDEPVKSLEGTTGNSTNVETDLETLVVDDAITQLDSLSVSEMQRKSVTDKSEDTPVANEESCTNHDKEGNQSSKTNRRASLPANHDVGTVVHTTRKVPSYMTPTQSAKAKLKEQASPRFGQDVAEKSGITRRHSLPSPMNGKMSSTPRVQRLVQASGKEGFKIDRSLSSSRDSSDKTIRAEWKR